MSSLYMIIDDRHVRTIFALRFLFCNTSVPSDRDFIYIMSLAPNKHGVWGNY